MKLDVLEAPDGGRGWLIADRSVLDEHANDAVDRAAGASGTRRNRLYAKARATFGRLLSVADTADARGSLGVSLTPIQQAVAALLAVLPSG